MNTRQLVEDETERGTPEAPWRSQKRKRTSSWYQRPPDAITSRVWSVVNRPLVQPLSLPYVTASRRSLSLSLFSSSRSSSFYLPSESPSRSVCLPSPAKFRQLPPRHLVFLSKVHSSRRVCRIKGEGGEATRNIVRETSQVKLNGEELIAARWWSVEFLERGTVYGSGCYCCRRGKGIRIPLKKVTNDVPSVLLVSLFYIYITLRIISWRTFAFIVTSFGLVGCTFIGSIRIFYYFIVKFLLFFCYDRG